MREIGSEFWEQYAPACRENAGNEAFLLSGRTALKYIIDDLRKSRNVRKALLPSYCCDSMILPFVQSGISVDFYQVHCDRLDYPYGTDADIVLLIDHFGYVNDQNGNIACLEKQAGKIILYDSTHKLDGNKVVERFADYVFCSYRKWFFCNYAKAVKHQDQFHVAGVLRQNDRFLKLREGAAHKKEMYITGRISDKQSSLSDFQTAEQILDGDYVGYAGSPVDVNVEEIVSHRRENAAYLISKLKEIPNISIWREKVGPNDTPLFVPILVDPCIRGELRNYLISKGIYCPIHWPQSTYHVVQNELYDMELSLVCDQRYDYADMERIACSIKDFMAKR